MDGRQVKHDWNSEVMNEEWDHQFLRLASILKAVVGFWHMHGMKEVIPGEVWVE